MNTKIGTIHLGYVGLPLAVEFGKKYSTFRYDIDKRRISELTNGFDRRKETEKQDIDKAEQLRFSTEIIGLPNCNIYIVTVPTPIDDFKRPDLRPLISSSRTVGSVVKKGDIIICESTVYPVCTEEECVAVIEAESGLKFNVDSFCGYSPERINLGDKQNTLMKIPKSSSGSTPETAQKTNELYKSIIIVGTYLVPALKVVEAAKFVEKTQRDVINISFVNEVTLFFDDVGIGTIDVLEAEDIKWNFLKFELGLVGGHCFGVDPYYMFHKAESLGYHPALIGSERPINDNMGGFVANKLVNLMIQIGIPVKGAKALVLGIIFKENCPDFHNHSGSRYLQRA